LPSVRLSIGTLKQLSMVQYLRESSSSRLRNGFIRCDCVDDESRRLVVKIHAVRALVAPDPRLRIIIAGDNSPAA
jgi:hypothetical protein